MSGSTYGPVTGRGAIVRVALLGLLLVVLLVGESPERTRFWKAVFDAGHAPLFGLVALLVRSLLAGGRGPAALRLRPSITAFGVSLVLGAVAEMLQFAQASREVSVADFLRDAAGAGAFLLLRSAWDASSTPANRTTAVRAVKTMLAAMLLIAAGSRLAIVSAVYVARNRAAPALARFDGSWWERELISTQGSLLTPARAGTQGLPRSHDAQGVDTRARLNLMPGAYPGLSVGEPYPDWRGFDRLMITIGSDLDGPLELTIRIHDARHNQRLGDRFNRRLVVKPGDNRFVIPLADIRAAPDGREMDMGRIRAVMLFAHRLKQPAHVYLGPIVLER